jgi:hypothetical protein
VAIDVLLSFNFAVVFNFYVFSFPPSKAQFLGNVPMNRQNNANGSSPQGDKEIRARICKCLRRPEINSASWRAGMTSRVVVLALLGMDSWVP